MHLIVGGQAQGKREYLLTLVPQESIADGARCPFAELSAAAAVDKLHVLAARWLAEGENPVEAALQLVETRPDIIFVCDEVGCGIVPIDRKERDWREMVGRMCCVLARQADRVDRVICGIPRRLK